MPKYSHSRHYAYRQQRYQPIFCSTSDVQMPLLIKEYLHNASDDPITTRNHIKHINHELNTNLEQILRAYLSQFWRHEVEKEQNGCTLWDQITGFIPRNHPPTRLSSSLYSQPDYQWWWQPPFAQDDGPSPSASIPTPPLLETPPSISPTNTPSTSSSPDSSPALSPYAVSPLDGASEKTRWQVYAERLFALLLRIPHFSLNTHMQRLIIMHQEANNKKDMELADIVRNYLATVLQ